MNGATRAGAIIVAAGRGTRMGGMDKCALPLHGRSLLSHSVATFAAVVDVVVVVVAADCVAAWHDIAEREAWLSAASIVSGGETRQESVRAGLQALTGGMALGMIAVHDGARPLVTVEVVRRCLVGAGVVGAAICAVPVTDTVKRVRDNRIVETLDRSELWAAQTPQVFRADLLQRAFAWAGRSPQRTFTDEAGLVAAFGHPVTIARGDRANIKVTEPADLIIAEALLGAREGAMHG